MASEKTERATAIAWRWPPESVTTSALTSGMLTPSESRCARACARIEPLSSTPQARVLALQEHVVEDRQPGHEREVLVDGVDAERARVDDRLAADTGLPKTEIVARVGLVEAREDLDQRGLAGAVVADQAEHLALAQVQAHVAQRRDRAEALGDVLDAQHVVGSAVGLHGRRLRAHAGFPRRVR